LLTARCGLVIVASVALTAQALAQQQKPPQQQEPEDVVRVYTDLVQTDVMVFDRQGRFVHDLKPEEFALRVDGKPQPIEFFERVAAGSADEEAQLSAARGNVAANPKEAPVPLDRGRAVFFYVDDFHLSAGDLILLRRALHKFVEDDLGQNDEAVITSASGQIGFLQQLTDNKEVLGAAIERIKARPNLIHDDDRPPMNEYQALIIDRSPATLTSRNYRDLTEFYVEKRMEELQCGDQACRDEAEIFVRNRARAILSQAVPVTTNTLASFESLVKSSTRLPGRKLVFFISDGFLLDPRNSDVPQRLEQITDAAARNGVVIYSMDARGLATNSPKAGDDVAIDLSGVLDRESMNELSASRQGMTTLALKTGGRTLFDTNGLETGLANAVKETSLYYLLAWRTSHESQASRKLPRIEVSLPNHPELTVRVRQGLMPIAAAENSRPAAKSEKGEPEKKSGPEKSSETKLREALAAVYPARELPVALDLQYQNTPDKGTVLTASMQVPIESLSFTAQSGTQTALVDLAGSVYDDQGKVRGSFNQRGTVTPASAEQARTPDAAVTYKYPLALPPGLYQVRVGARDAVSGRTGTANEWVEIPDTSARRLALSSVVAGELTAQNEKSEARQMRWRADHSFRRDSSLRFQLYVYNASLAPADSKPDLVLQLQLMRDRQPVVTTPLQQVATSGLQTFERIRTGGDLSLKGLPPGRYLLLISVIDRAARTSASQEMRFQID
jgi:VWFA-related protein